MPPAVHVDQQVLYQKMVSGFDEKLDMWREIFSESVYHKLMKSEVYLQINSIFPQWSGSRSFMIWLLPTRTRSGETRMLFLTP